MNIKWRVALKLGQVHVQKTSPQCMHMYFLKDLLRDLATTLYYILLPLACIFAHTAFYLLSLIYLCSCYPGTTKLHFI